MAEYGVSLRGFALENQGKPNFVFLKADFRGHRNLLSLISFNDETCSGEE
jgi:hypothetical protein